MAKRRRPSAMPPGPVLAAVIALAGCPERKRSRDVPPQTAPPDPIDAYDPRPQPPQAVPPQVAPQEPLPPPPELPPQAAPQPPQMAPPPQPPQTVKKKIAPQRNPPPPIKKIAPQVAPPRDPPQAKPPGTFEFPRQPPALVGPFDRGD